MAEVADVGKSKTRRKGAKEGGGKKVAGWKTTKAGDTGNGFAQDRQASGYGDAGATRPENPGFRCGEVFFTREACRKRTPKTKGELVGKLGREEQSRGGDKAAEERSVDPAQRGHDNRAWDGEKEVSDKQGNSDEPCEPAVILEENAQGGRTQEGLKQAAPKKEGDDNGGQQKRKHKPDAVRTGHKGTSGSEVFFRDWHQLNPNERRLESPD